MNRQFIIGKTIKSKWIDKGENLECPICKHTVKAELGKEVYDYCPFCGSKLSDRKSAEDSEILIISKERLKQRKEGLHA